MPEIPKNIVEHLYYKEPKNGPVYDKKPFKFKLVKGASTIYIPVDALLICSFQGRCTNGVYVDSQKVSLFAIAHMKTNSWKSHSGMFRHIKALIF